MTATSSNPARECQPEIEQYFTLVFKGDIRQFKGNPLKTETPFGIPFAAGVGNAFEENDELRDVLEGMTEPLPPPPEAI